MSDHLSNEAERSERKKETYSYFDLPDDGDIRLLAIQPSENLHDALVGRICYANIPRGEQDLFDFLSYEALSHAWGTAVASEPIEMLDSRLPGREGQLSITPNLSNALRRLRNEKTERYIWVDALCIDQANPFEKPKQIAGLRRIYENATRVIVFLGDIDETSEDEINESVENLIALHDTYRCEPSTIEQGFAAYRHRLVTMAKFFWDPPVEEGAKRWASLLRLFQRPWFFRMWSATEMVRAEKAIVVWGPHVLGFMRLHTVAGLIYLTSSDIMQPFDVRSTGIYSVVMMCAWQRSARRLLEEPSMATMIGFRNFETRHKVDKRNAAVGMLNLRKAVFPLDLGSPADIFHDFAIQSIQGNGNGVNPLKILSFVDGMPPASRLKIPSWAPDWSQIEVPESFCIDGVPHVTKFQAGGTSRIRFWFERGWPPNVLRILGKGMDTLDEVSSAYDPPVRETAAICDGTALALKTRRRTRECFIQYANILHRNTLRHENESERDLVDKAMRILICNRNSTGAPAEAEIINLFGPFHDFYMHERYEDINDKTKAQFDRIHLAGRFESLMKRWSMVHRVFFVTRKGYFG